MKKSLTDAPEAFLEPVKNTNSVKKQHDGNENNR